MNLYIGSTIFENPYSNSDFIYVPRKATYQLFVKKFREIISYCKRMIDYYFSSK